MTRYERQREPCRRPAKEILHRAADRRDPARRGGSLRNLPVQHAQPQTLHRQQFPGNRAVHRNSDRRGRGHGDRSCRSVGLDPLGHPAGGRDRTPTLRWQKRGGSASVAGGQTGCLVQGAPGRKGISNDTDGRLPQGLGQYDRFLCTGDDHGQPRGSRGLHLSGRLLSECQSGMVAGGDGGRPRHCLCQLTPP